MTVHVLACMAALLLLGTLFAGLDNLTACVWLQYSCIPPCMLVMSDPLQHVCALPPVCRSTCSVCGDQLQHQLQANSSQTWSLASCPARLEKRQLQLTLIWWVAGNGEGSTMYKQHVCCISLHVLPCPPLTNYHLKKQASSMLSMQTLSSLLCRTPACFSASWI
jgi:hypothetical protein